MIRFSIPVLLVLCCWIVCFSFGTVDAQLNKDKPVEKPVGKRAGKPDKPVNLFKPDRTGKKAQPDDVQAKIGELENLVKKLKNQLDNSVRFISIYFRPFPFNLFVANYKK